MAGEMVERVARAICLDVGEGHDWTQFETEARAAIEAMREPTVEMAEAIWANSWKRNVILAWQAGIDAALRP